jgi:hypothetical protein
MPSAISAEPMNATAGHADTTTPIMPNGSPVEHIGADRGRHPEPEHAARQRNRGVPPGRMQHDQPGRQDQPVHA